MRKSGFIAWALWGVLLVALPALSSRIKNLEAQWVELPRRVETALSPEIAKLISLGHVGAMVDWLWIHAISDPSLAHVAEGQRAPIFYDFDLATDLDPLYFELYWAAANLLSVVRDDNVGATLILEKSKKVRRDLLPRFPDWFRSVYWKGEWFLSVQLGFIYMMELGQLGKAVPEFLDAARFPQAPPAIREIEEKMQEPDGMYRVGFNVLDRWIGLAEQAGEPEELISELRRKRRNFEVNHFLFVLNHEFSSSRVSFDRFSAQKGAILDPWGGKLFLNDRGRIDTTTEHHPVFDFERN